MSMKVEGVLTAIVTPFDGQGHVDFAALQRQVERQVKHGNGVFCAGTNGEFFTLNATEKAAIAKTCAHTATGRVPVVAHIGEISTHETIELGKEVADAGVDAVSVITPWFVPMSQDDLIAHYTQIADEMPVPMFLYNIPPRTGNVIKPETAAKLADHPNIIGLKDSAGTQDSLDGFLEIAKGRDDFAILVGPDSLIHHGMINGALGSISGLGNLIPATVHAIVAAAKKHDLKAGEQAQEHCTELRKALYALGFAPTMVKRALACIQPDVGASRTPIQIPASLLPQIQEIANKFVEV